MPWPDALPAGEIHLHMTDDRTIVAPQLLAGYEALLSADEAARRDRFRFDQHRHQFLVARALVRTVLSLYRPDVDPAAWRFETNAYGRPRVAGAGAGDLDFNLSHTQGRMVLAVCRAPSPGVDIERLDRQMSVIDLATQVFSATEVMELSALPACLQRRRFFDLWTLKESYIKARGMGLSIPLKDFSISFPKSGGPSIRFAGGVDDDTARWRLWSIVAGEEHSLSLALADAGGMQLRLFHTIPLLGATEVDCRTFPET